MTGAQPIVRSNPPGAEPSVGGNGQALPSEGDKSPGTAADATTGFEAQTLTALLSLFGPAAPTFLLQLQRDLNGALCALQLAADGPDWPVIQARTHTLIALSGTVGAHGLCLQARELNDLTHLPTPDGSALAARMPAMLADLAVLIDGIGRMILPTEGAAP